MLIFQKKNKKPKVYSIQCLMIFEIVRMWQFKFRCLKISIVSFCNTRDKN